MKGRKKYEYSSSSSDGESGDKFEAVHEEEDHEQKVRPSLQ